MIRFTASITAVLFCVSMIAGVPSPAAQEVVRQPAVPIDVHTPSSPTWVPSRDGMHALYELHLAVYRWLPMELVRLDVLDAADGKVLANLSGEALLRDLLYPGRSLDAAERGRLDGGDIAVLFVELVRPRGEPLPAAVRHVWYIRRVPAEGEPPSDKLLMMESASVPIAPAPRFVLGPPLAGAGWIAANGLGNGSDHRRTLFAIDGQVRISQRYAIDFIQVGPDGRLASKAEPENADFPGYGAALLAVADGTVVALRDGIPENRPFAEDVATDMTLETIGGNSVMLDIGGAVVTYAHLQPGSATVKPGQWVRRGETIGRLGNSGNSDAPHLHLQVTDLPAVLAAEGQPFVLEGFGWRGAISDLDAWLATGEPWRPETTEVLVRHHELPLGGDIVDFPP